ncbi:MAG: sugar kinase [Anaerolineae bacterium]
MPELVALGEALVEVMRTGLDQGLDSPGPFVGPYPSGAPAIFADAAARLGARSGFAGTVGDDAFGDCITHRLRLDGVDCGALRRDPARVTGIAFVSYRSDGSRRFLFHLADSAAAHVTLDQIPPGWLDDVRYVHITGSSLSAGTDMREICYAVARYVAGRGGTVSLDPNLRPELIAPDRIRAVCEPVLACARIVFPSGAELLTLTGEESAEAGVTQLLQRGIEIVALKQGDQGSTIYTRAGSQLVAPYTVTEVDPTGAGDCYDAAFVVGLAEGWDLARVGRFANAAGALATTRQGPMEGAHTRAEVLQFMQEAGHPL